MQKRERGALPFRYVLQAASLQQQNSVRKKKDLHKEYMDGFVNRGVLSEKSIYMCDDN